MRKYRDVPHALQQDDFVMLETPGEDGSMSQIIYRNGGEVRASSVETLCDKVRRADLQRSSRPQYL